MVFHLEKSISNSVAIRRRASESLIRSIASFVDVILAKSRGLPGRYDIMTSAFYRTHDHIDDWSLLSNELSRTRIRNVKISIQVISAKLANQSENDFSLVYLYTNTVIN